MKITKFVQFDQEVDIELSSEDVQAIFDSEPDSLPNVLYGLNTVATFLKGVSDSKIAEMTDGQREVVSKFLSTQSDRYNL
uniref:Uncharacterized protein n=1 Tax=viral metagenome TaxID=1070528 RepID=A0A6H1ZNW0_9ZZZZ